MTMQFSDFLAAQAARVAELAAPGLSRSGSPGTPPQDQPQRARQLVNALIVALTADDRRPLITVYELDRPAELARRLDAAINDLQCIRRAATKTAEEIDLDTEQRLSVAITTAEEMGALVRQLSVECASCLEQGLRSAASESSARGTSLSVTMHELRRPLTILSSYGQLLSAGMLGSLPDSAVVAVEGITASTEMMVRMVNSLAEVARIEDPDDRMSLEVMGAEEVVAAAAEPVAVEAKLRGTIITTDVQEGVLLRADRRRLTLALTNLIGNAVKHGPADAMVEVTVRGDADGAHFVVRDHGGGFPTEDAEHLFDKYFRSVAERRRKVPGSGLGLYIVRSVVERHGGSVAARCVAGNGAEFEMIIPMHEGDR